MNILTRGEKSIHAQGPVFILDDDKKHLFEIFLDNENGLTIYSISSGISSALSIEPRGINSIVVKAER